MGRSFLIKSVIAVVILVIIVYLAGCRIQTALISQEEQINALKTALNEPAKDKPKTIPVKVKKPLIFKAKITYYCDCEKCTGKPFNSPSRGLTSSGRFAREFHTVAMDKQIPFGTLIEFNGNIYEVEDRGGQIKGNDIDIFVKDHQQALNNGVVYENVKIIKIGKVNQ